MGRTPEEIHRQQEEWRRQSDMTPEQKARALKIQQDLAKQQLGRSPEDTLTGKDHHPPAKSVPPAVQERVPVKSHQKEWEGYKRPAETHAAEPHPRPAEKAPAAPAEKPQPPAAEKPPAGHLPEKPHPTTNRELTFEERAKEYLKEKGKRPQSPKAPEDTHGTGGKHPGKPPVTETPEAPKPEGKGLAGTLKSGAVRGLGGLGTVGGMVETYEGIRDGDGLKVVKGLADTATGGAAATMKLEAARIFGGIGAVAGGLEHGRDAINANDWFAKSMYGTGAAFEITTGVAILTKTPWGLAAYSAGTLGWWAGRTASHYSGLDDKLTNGMDYRINKEANEQEKQIAHVRSDAVNALMGMRLEDLTSVDSKTISLAIGGALDQQALSTDPKEKQLWHDIYGKLKDSLAKRPLRQR